MDFKQLFQVARRRWLTIAMLFLIALGSSAALSFSATPQYESKARIFVSADVSDSSNAYLADLSVTGRLQSYADLASSTDLMQQVIDDLNLSLTPGELTDHISVVVLTDTTLLEITVTDPDPRTAQSIARSESELLPEYLADLEKPVGTDQAQITATITNPASYNATAVTPRTVLNLVIAGLIGLIVGSTLALARELLDRSVTKREDIEKVTGSPVLASIGFDSGIKKSPLLTDLGGFAPRTEAFRLLRTNLQFLDLDTEPRCLVITSAVPAEGKTTTSTNLAVALAQAGRRVLLVDGDLRRPRVAGLLGLDGAIGLTTVLVGNADVKDAIQIHEPSGLHFLASGAKPPNPTEILQSKVTRDLISELRDLYEMVIIDAPPLLPVADATVLATIADGAILVTRHGKTSRDQLKEAVTRLDQVGARLFGVVVNMIPRRAANNYYYYYEELTPKPNPKAK